MNIETRKDKKPLEGKYIEKTDILMEASTLLYEIINHSYMTSGTPLSININDRNYSIADLYYEGKERLKQVEQGGERLVFLNMSILEDTFKKALPLLLVPMQEIADNDMSCSDKINRLRTIFNNNEYKTYWSKKAASYKKLIESYNMTIKTSDYEDLTLIMEPLVNAFTLYGNGEKSSGPKIMRVRSGEKSSAAPELMTTVCKFSSAKEFVTALEQSEKEAIVAFGAVEQTERQTNDYFFEFLHGESSGGRICNIMRNDKKSREEVLDSINEYSRVLYLGVKSKDNIWLMKMPYLRESQGIPYNDSSDKYYFGKRAGYAPYEVFFKDNTAMPDGTTYLATKRLGYRLDEIMDDSQKIWLPAFLEETVRKFFKSEVECEDYILPEEAYIKAGKYEIMPVFNNLPATKTVFFDMPTPEEALKDDALMLELVEKFHITQEDIKDAVMIENEIKNEEKIKGTILTRSRAAYLRVIGNKIVSLMNEVCNVRRSVIYILNLRKDIILKEAKAGLYNDFMETVVDKRHILDENGEPAYKTSFRYGREEKEPLLQRTETDDAKWYSLEEYCRALFNYAVWDGEKTSSKPPVVVKLRPCKKEHYKALLGLKEEEMHDLLRYAEHISHFNRNYIRNMPNNLCVASEDWLKKDSCYLPKLANVNICMKKNVWKNEWKSSDKEER